MSATYQLAPVGPLKPGSRAGPRSNWPGRLPVASPFSSVTCAVDEVAAMPSAFCTRRRAPPGRSARRSAGGLHAGLVEHHEVGGVAGAHQAAVGSSQAEALSKVSLRTACSRVKAWRLRTQ